MDLKILKLLSGLLLAFCLVTFVSAGAGTANGTDSIVESTPEVVPVTDIYEVSEETIENITEKNPAVTDEVNLIPIGDDSATDEESEEGSSLMSEFVSETTKIVIEESDFNWEGEVSLTEGPDFKYSPTTNLTAEYDINATSDLAALLKASEKGGFDFYTDDSDYPEHGTFWLTGIDGINNAADWSYYWSVYINGNATESGLSSNILNDGDLLQFCYGYSSWTEGIFPSPTSFTNIVNITVDVKSDFNWEGEVSLTEGPDFKYSPTTNLTAEYDINATSDLAALLKASEKGGFDFYTDDSDYPEHGTFWLAGIDGINNAADWSYYWSVYINGNATESGLSGNILNDGDLLQFCYGYSSWTEGIFPSPTSFTNIVNITVDVKSDFNWEGEVSLTEGPDFKYSPTTNLTAEYDINATSDLAALLKASEKGGFDFYTDDSDYPEHGTFWLTGIDGINNAADWSYYWSVYINGNATESGLSGNILNDGDLLQFCYGYSSWTEGIFPSPTSFTNIVNITVDVKSDFNWEGEVSLTEGPDFKYSPTTNLTAEYDVNATSDLAALLKASEKGGFDFYTDDSNYPEHGTFWLAGIDGINNAADWSYYWSVYINGNATESGLSGNILNDGDHLQFCYGYSSWTEGIFPSPTSFTNIVNITVDVESDFNWEGEVSLTEGPDFKYSPTTNLTAEYDVNATSDLAALLKASEIGVFDFYTDDSDYPEHGTFWLAGIDGINNAADWSYYWSVYINGNATESGLSGNILNDGDLLQFCYGYSSWTEGIFPSPTSFTNIVNITVDVKSDFNWEGEVSLTEGPDFKYSPTTNLTAEYDVNATSDLAALLKASEKGGFDFYTDDSDYPEHGTFWLAGIDGINNAADWSYYWSVYINGNATESGLSGNILNDGDLLQFCYGYSSWTEGIFPSPTSFTNIVNITVNIEEYSSMAMLIPSKGLMEDTPYTTQISVANITDASGLSTFLTWNPDVIDILNVTANSSVFSGSAIYLNLTEGYAEVALTNTDGMTTDAPAPVFDVKFRSKKGLHQETILLGTGTQYSDKSFINHTLPCEDGIFRIERVKGDFNGNGFVDIGDVSRVAYMVADKTPVDMEADFNENGRIDVGDAAAIAWFFIGKTGYL